MDENLEQPVEIKLDTGQFFSDWAEYTVQRLHEALDIYREPTWTDALYNSIKTELIRANGDVNAVITKFLVYGRFFDMGVGRGVSVGSAGSGAVSAARDAHGQLKAYRRKPKHWYSKTYYAEVQKVKELYLAKFGKEIPVAIKEALTADINLSA